MVKPQTVERVVAAQFFRFTKMVPVPGTDNYRPVMVTATRNETVQVLPVEVELSEPLGAFHPTAATGKDDAGNTVVELDVREMSDTDLATWIKEDKPAAKEVVELAEGDPQLAERLLIAERTATNGRPRKTVNEELTKIMDDAAAAGTGLVTEGTP